MSAKKAILLMVLVEVLIYLFLLVGWPMLNEWLYECFTCTEGRDLPWIIYCVPGFLGLWYIGIILYNAKKEGEDSE